MKPLDAYFDGETWVLMVPFGLPASALAATRDYVHRINYDRWLSSTGGRRERIGIALAALKAGRIIQRIATKGDVVLFQSTERQTTRIYG